MARPDYSHSDFTVLTEALRRAARDVETAQLRRHHLRPSVTAQLPGATRRALVEVSELSRLMSLPSDEAVAPEDFLVRRGPVWPAVVAGGLIVTLALTAVPFLVTLGAGLAVSLWPSAMPVAGLSAAGGVLAGVLWVLQAVIRARIPGAPIWRWLENALLSRARPLGSSQTGRAARR